MTQTALSETPAPLMLLSYDVSAINRSAASRVAHLIFGRKDAGPDSPVPYILRAGVVWIGQSVFLLPRPLAVELAEELHGLGAMVTMGNVSIPRTEIESFQRRAQQRRVVQS
ncbi:MAG: hypothetical protein E6K06_02420 [Methanobacteriota archaeon]|nr:MAG: hypothetical protein E6K06_02420 [Euryarchaeota archaeon]